ncbi:trypsin-like peptidase domain-containing protein [Allorhizocola rhizosphaerae]|uniref:trypsin-like peptidase domain-containing protein n=1 Tax=Allorhizocola rhizosphaerae TaxID=1872709 RepID=UPI000E3DF759|nr:trypsin-like peptidase domain-containing protein [Allorhizocola rhizosphaerae]
MRPEHAIARVRRAADRSPVGLAFAVGGRFLVTCAHVVNAALGRPLREASPPEQSELQLVFPFGDGLKGHQPLRSASVAVWLPSDPDRFDLEDVALLELHEDLPRGVPVLRPATDIRHAAVQMVGPVPKRAHHVHVNGELMGAVDRSRFHIDERLSGVFRVVQGFSGGPVWYQESGKVVGMLQAASVDDRATDVYIIGRDTIREVYSAFGPRKAVEIDGVALGSTVLFGVAGALAAVSKVGWSWMALAAGLAVAGVVYAVGRLVR